MAKVTASEVVEINLKKIEEIKSSFTEEELKMFNDILDYEKQLSIVTIPRHHLRKYLNKGKRITKEILKNLGKDVSEYPLANLLIGYRFEDFAKKMRERVTDLNMTIHTLKNLNASFRNKWYKLKDLEERLSHVTQQEKPKFPCFTIYSDIELACGLIGTHSFNSYRRKLWWLNKLKGMHDALIGYVNRHSDRETLRSDLQFILDAGFLNVLEEELIDVILSTSEIPVETLIDNHIVKVQADVNVFIEAEPKLYGLEVFDKDSDYNKLVISQVIEKLNADI